MSRYRRLRQVAAVGCALVTAVAGLSIGSPAHADPRPLALRFSLTGWLGVEQVGNTLLSCPDGSTADGEPCAAAQAGGAVGNDDYRMSYVDVDGNPATFDSSSAQLIAPPGATIAFAGLYWGGDSGSGNNAGTTGCQSGPSANQVTPPPAPGRANQILVKVGGKGYVGVRATSFDRLDSSLGGATVQGFADVTTLFAGYSGAAAATAIPLTVANAQLAQGLNCSGGWSLVLVYAYPAADPTYAPAYRSVQLFDGLAAVAPGTPVSAAAEGFRVATDGAPTGGEVGVVLYDGDRGAGGDQLSVNGTPVGDDIGDSTVAGSGYGAALSTVGASQPAYGNSLGYDSQVLDLPDGALAAGVTSASASLGTTGDQVTVGALVLVSRVDPLLVAAQTVTRSDGSEANGTDVRTGDRLRYTLHLSALTPLTGLVVDAPLPGGLAPVAGSLTLNGAPIDPAALTGDGAALQLAALNPGVDAVLTYDATVTAGAPAGVPLVSRATVRYDAGAATLVGYSAQVAVLANRVDLALKQVASGATVGPDRPTGLTVTVTNQGKVPASGVTVADPIPATLSLVTADTAQGSFDSASGTWSVGALAPGASATLRLNVVPGAPPAPVPTAPSSAPSAPAAAPSGSPAAPRSWPATVTAEVSGADQPDRDSLFGDGLAGEDDQGSVALTVTASAATAAPSATADGGVVASTTGSHRFHVDTLVTLLAAVLAATLIMLGALVFLSARRAAPRRRAPAPPPRRTAAGRGIPSRRAAGSSSTGARSRR